MAKFRNEHGDVIETNDPATVLNYQHDPNFTEVEEKDTKRKSSKADDDKQ